MATKSQKLEDQAATAALYVTKGKDNKSVTKSASSNNYPLDEHNKLSSAGAATSLKHADPRTLPAFPVVGVADPASSAGGAATLANKNKKSFEHWKPGEIPAANKAAFLAKDYKMAPLWHEELSAGASKAALQAAKEGGDVKVWRPSPTSAGNSAAGQAMRMKGLSPQLDYGHTDDGNRRALMAATQSMASGRKRAGSTPVQPPASYPDSKNSAANALKAATSVSRRGQPVTAATVPTGVPIDAGKIHNAAITNLSREMYTSHPPVAPEVEEKNRQAGLRASAIAMAQQMYNVQQKAIEEAAVDQSLADSRYGATHAHNRPGSVMSEEHAAPQYANLQQAAQKLAAERLAKLHDEHAAYRTYYGTQASPQGHKLSIRGRARRRASSDGQAGEGDEERSKQIRSQMSLFTDKLAQVDNKKRKTDRESLMAAAQRNVRASMTAQDEKVFNETGKVSPAMMAEWESKAKAKAEAESSTRMVNHGKVNIGGGRYMDQSEIDAIAAAKVQPTLDEVTATAEKQRARDEELRQQQLERERTTAEKQNDQKVRDQQTKEAWRLFKEEEKREARAKKDEERTRKLDEKKLRDAEKQRLRDEKTAPKAPAVAPKEETVAEPVLAPAEPTVATAEPVVATAEPPVLEPIPHVASIAPTEQLQSATTKEPGVGTGAIEEERIDPTFIPMSHMDEITASQANLAPTDKEEPFLGQVSSAERDVPASGQAISGDAEEIARRVFAAPIENETPLDPALEPETAEIIKTTANVEEAPIVKSENATVSAAPETKPTPNAEPSIPTKHDQPVATRVAPSTAATAAVPAPTTETTVSGPTPSPKSKDGKGVSSWLKTKFSRRTSKSINPENPTAATDSKEKAFVGGATLTGASEAGKTSSDHGDSSMRNVAMAGKDTTATTATAPELSPVVSPNDEELYSASPLRNPDAVGGNQRPSSSTASVSSLSSDEDPRGRSAVPREREPLSQQEFLESELKSGKNVDPKLVAGEQLDPALGLRHGKGESSISGGGEEFEEARDEFDSEKLSPPDKTIIAGKDRVSGSPARDSKFMEDL